MEGKTQGLVAVVTTSIVGVAAVYVAVKYAPAISQITKSGVSGLGTVAKGWQN